MAITTTLTSTTGTSIDNSYVLSTDTFEIWRQKTNRLYTDLVKVNSDGVGSLAVTADIASATSSLTNFVKLSADNQTIAGTKTFTSGLTSASGILIKNAPTDTYFDTLSAWNGEINTLTCTNFRVGGKLTVIGTTTVAALTATGTITAASIIIGNTNVTALISTAVSAAAINLSNIVVGTGNNEAKLSLKTDQTTQRIVGHGVRQALASDWTGVNFGAASTYTTAYTEINKLQVTEWLNVGENSSVNNVNNTGVINSGAIFANGIRVFSNAQLGIGRAFFPPAGSISTERLIANTTSTDVLSISANLKALSGNSYTLSEYNRRTLSGLIQPTSLTARDNDKIFFTQLGGNFLVGTDTDQASGSTDLTRHDYFASHHKYYSADNRAKIAIGASNISLIQKTQYNTTIGTPTAEIIANTYVNLYTAPGVEVTGYSNTIQSSHTYKIDSSVSLVERLIATLTTAIPEFKDTNNSNTYQVLTAVELAALRKAAAYFLEHSTINLLTTTRNQIFTDALKTTVERSYTATANATASNTVAFNLIVAPPVGSPIRGAGIVLGTTVTATVTVSATTSVTLSQNHSGITASSYTISYLPILNSIFAAKYYNREGIAAPTLDAIKATLVAACLATAIAFVEEKLVSTVHEEILMPYIVVVNTPILPLLPTTNPNRKRRRMNIRIPGDIIKRYGSGILGGMIEFTNMVTGEMYDRIRYHIPYDTAIRFNFETIGEIPISTPDMPYIGIGTTQISEYGIFTAIASDIDSIYVQNINTTSVNKFYITSFITRPKSLVAQTAVANVKYTPTLKTYAYLLNTASGGNANALISDIFNIASLKRYVSTAPNSPELSPASPPAGTVANNMMFSLVMISNVLLNTEAASSPITTSYNNADLSSNANNIIGKAIGSAKGDPGFKDLSLIFTLNETLLNILNIEGLVITLNKNTSYYTNALTNDSATKIAQAIVYTLPEQNLKAAALSDNGIDLGEHCMYEVPRGSGCTIKVTSQLITGSTTRYNVTTVAAIFKPFTSGTRYNVNDILQLEPRVIALQSYGLNTLAEFTVAALSDATGSVLTVQLSNSGNYNGDIQGTFSTGVLSMARLGITWEQSGGVFSAKSGTIATAGNNYELGDLLIIQGGKGTSSARFLVSSISATGAVTGVTLSSKGSYATIPENGYYVNLSVNPLVPWNQLDTKAYRANVVTVGGRWMGVIYDAVPTIAEMEYINTAQTTYNLWIGVMPLFTKIYKKNGGNASFISFSFKFSGKFRDPSNQCSSDEHYNSIDLYRYNNDKSNVLPVKILTWSYSISSVNLHENELSNKNPFVNHTATETQDTTSLEAGNYTYFFYASGHHGYTQNFQYLVGADCKLTLTETLR